MRTLTFLSHVGLIGTIALSAGCLTRTALTPAPTAHVRAPETAISNVDGVSMTVEADAWPGNKTVTTYVTPLRVVIRNESDHDIRIDYDDFALVAPDGKQYAALPPYDVRGAVYEPALVGPYDPIMDPELDYDDNFFIAPYYAGIYPGLTPYPGACYYDPVYFHQYYDYWAQIPLPTPEMLRRVLPAGILEPGGRVGGFLYFERVGKRTSQVYFRADLEDEADGRRLGEIRIPFTVAREPVA